MFYEMNWLLAGANWHTLWTSMILVILGYFVGSFLFSRFWISVKRKGDATWFNKRLGQKTRITRFGTSMIARTMGKRFATAQFLIDIAKPMIAFWAIAFPMTQYCPYFEYAITGSIFLGTIIGHLYPVYWKFKDGGLGIATGFGMLLSINWFIGFVGLFGYIIVVSITHHSGRAGIFGAMLGIMLLAIPFVSNFKPFGVYYVIQSGVTGMAQFIYPSLIGLTLILHKFRWQIIEMLRDWKVIK